MLLGIYEKQKNVQKARQVVKQYKKEATEPDKQKILNQIMQKIESKKMKIFDYEFYSNLLHCKLDKVLKEKYEQQKQEEKERKREIGSLQQNTSAMQVKNQEDNESVNGVYRRTNYSPEHRRRYEFKERIKVKEGNNVTREEKQTEKNHYLEIIAYLREKRRAIYLKLQSIHPEIQKTAISQWDRMENLMDRVNDNRDNPQYLDKVYEKIQQLKDKENSWNR